MRFRNLVVCTLLLLLISGSSWAFYLEYASTGEGMTAAAKAYLATLDEKQRKTSLLKFADTKKRVGWHFIPKDYRKGLQIRHMNEKQSQAALTLLKSCLSEAGYKKVQQIMALEGVLHEMEKKNPGRFARDPKRYYFTVFGKPTDDGKWGLSIEGHHLSLNFVIEGNKILSSTPTFLAANPATVKSKVPGNHGFKKGTRVLKAEEQLAFELVNSLSEEQRKKAIIAKKAPKEIRAAGSAQPPKDENVGIRFADLTGGQQDTIKNLVGSYLAVLPREIQQARIAGLVQAGPDQIRFAWAGSLKPGVGHYYRIQGPTFLIEFVNTQPDPAGNPANHIHCVWRDMKGDFAIPLSL